MPSLILESDLRHMVSPTFGEASAILAPYFSQASDLGKERSIHVRGEKRWLPALAIVALFLAVGCGGDSESSDLEIYQAEDAIELAAQQIEVASWVAEDGQVHENLVEYFPPHTAGAVEMKLRSLEKKVERLSEVPTEIQRNLTDATKFTRLSVKGMSSLNEAITHWNEAWDKQTEGSARKAYRAFGDVLIVPDEVDQELTQSIENSVEAAELAQALLEESGELEPAIDSRVETLIKKAETAKMDADDLGDDRESQLVVGRQNLKRQAAQLAAASAAPVIPEGACAVIPAEDLETVGVDITVFAENCDQDSIDLVHQVYADSNYRENGLYEDGSSSCVTAGAWERFMSTCQSPFGEVSFTAPGSA